MNYLLDAAKLVQTADVLALRVRERLPGSGLSKVAEDVARVARGARGVAARVARANWPLRFVVVLLTLALGAGVAFAGYSLRLPIQVASASELVQGIEALINIVVFGSIAVFFVFTIESRLKRRRVLRLIGQLRSLAHVIDMHQLSKDPDRLDDPLPPTRNSPPKMQLTKPLLARYLDYCSELLAILSKLAALQAQQFDDSQTFAAVNDLENLTAGLSRKIWQKIMIIDRLPSPPPATAKSNRFTDVSQSPPSPQSTAQSPT